MPFSAKAILWLKEVQLWVSTISHSIATKCMPKATSGRKSLYQFTVGRHSPPWKRSCGRACRGWRIGAQLAFFWCALEPQFMKCCPTFRVGSPPQLTSSTAFTVAGYKSLLLWRLQSLTYCQHPPPSMQSKPTSLSISLFDPEAREFGHVDVQSSDSSPSSPIIGGRTWGPPMC